MILTNIEKIIEPAKALSDGANMLPLARLEALLDKMCRIAEAVR